MLAATNAIFLHLGIPVFFWGDRPSCRWMLEDLLGRIWQKRGRV